jgi:HEAT repeat protein
LASFGNPLSGTKAMRRNWLLLLLPAVPIGYFAGEMLLTRLLPRLRNEVVYQGRPASDWLTALEEERPGARAIFNHQDPAALPVLLQLLQAGDPRVRTDAILTLGNLAPPAEAIRDSFRDALEQETLPNNVLLAARVLVKADPRMAITVLAHVLRQNQVPLVRSMAAVALQETGAQAPLACQALEQALQDEAEIVRLRAAHGLWHLTRESRRVVPALVKLCDSSNDQVLVLTADCLRAIGPAAAEAGPALATLVEGRVGHVRRRACWALADLHCKDPAVVSALIAALKDDLEDTRSAAARALGYSAMAEAVPALVEALQDPRLRSTAIEALGRLGAYASTALPSLREHLRDAEPWTRLLAAWSLARINPALRDPLPVLEKALHDSATQFVAADGVARIRGDDTILTETLRHALTNSNARTRESALWFAREVGPRARGLVPELTMLLGRQDHLERLWAAEALGGIGPAAKPAAGALRAVAEDPNVELRQAALQALGRISPDERPRVEEKPEPALGAGRLQ